MTLLHLINFVITKLCNCLPPRFFFQNTEKETTKIQYLRSTKQKRRIINTTDPQQIPRQRHSPLMALAVDDVEEQQVTMLCQV